MNDFMNTSIERVTDLGFTGTRAGMSEPQKRIITELIHELDSPQRAHHGDCIGADADFHKIIRDLVETCVVVIHPPLDPKYRAYCQGTLLMPERDYLIRNKRIVDSSTIMLATPDGPERRHSGTWSTIRYARELGVRVIVVMPDGSIQP